MELPEFPASTTHRFDNGGLDASALDNLEGKQNLNRVLSCLSMTSKQKDLDPTKNLNHGLNMIDGNKVTQICEDVLVEIICRLPEKALARSKCICKAWNHFINETCIPRYSISPPVTCTVFVIKTADLAFNSTRPKRMLKYADMNGNSLSWFVNNIQGLPFHHSPHCLLDSCNGLLLFYTPDNYQYYVCNPTTKEFILLPDECKHVECLSAILAFDPCKSVHFKVVCFFRVSEDTHLRVKICSSKSLKWDTYTIPIPSDPPIDLWLRPLFHFCGKVYINSRSGKALCLDLAFMTISQILLPEYEEGNLVSLDYGMGVLGISVGQLCYTITQCYNAQLKMWIFNDVRCEDSKWILKHCICMLDVEELAPLAAPGYFTTVFPFGFSPSCDVVYVGTRTVIFSYEFKSGKCKEVTRMRSDIHLFSHPMFSVVCCLASLNSINGSTSNPVQLITTVSATNKVTEAVELGILHRLPEKALVRCKCISKNWNRLISEICIPRYLKYPLTVCAVFVEKTTETGERRKRLNYVDINEKGPSKFICNMQGQLPFARSADCLLDSSNGLLLFYIPDNYQYYVCNPTTEELMLLPDDCKYAADCLSTALDFDPWESVVHIKVVSLFRLIDTKLRVEIYSSKSLKWDIFTVTLPANPALNTWLLPSVCFREKVYINSRCGTALCLDPTSRSISPSRLPEYGGKRSKYVAYHAGVLRASNRYLTYTATTKNNTRLKVWSYTEHCGWVMVHNVGLWRIKRMIPGTVTHATLVRALPFCFIPSSDTAYVGTRTIVFSYDLRCRECKEVAVSSKPESLHFTHQMFSVAGCPVSLNSINTSASYPVQLITSAPWHGCKGSEVSFIACKSKFALSLE